MLLEGGGGLMIVIAGFESGGDVVVAVAAGCASDLIGIESVLLLLLDVGIGGGWMNQVMMVVVEVNMR